ncbi:MAG TPA: hypothetical protein VFR34_09500, partial [Paracoccaceae bacterium]|nr:hypothetical protein [Paracoccaceae bacterium]
ERAVQAASLRLFGALAGILWRSALALGGSMLVVVAGDRLGLAPEAEVVAFLSRLDVILGLTIVITLGWLGGRRLWPST